MLDRAKKLGISDLLDQDISSYEYFYSQPKEIQKEIEMEDISSFEELQQYVDQIKNRYN